MVAMNSAERVESMNELLMEILVRLPEKSIFGFMSVSKRWNNLIADPFFLQSHRRRRCSGGHGGGRLLALIERNYLHENPDHPRPLSRPPMNILPIMDHRQLGGNHRNMKYVPRLLGYFINSSNGLILCGRHPSQYHVLNPVSKKWFTLPRPSPPKSDGYKRKSIGLMCEENTTELAADYTVVRASTHAENSTMRIETYSSKTRTWVVKILAADNLGLLRLCKPPVVANGAFHWYSAAQHCDVIGVYNPSDFDGDNHHVQLMELPVTEDDADYVSRTMTRSPADDTLWYGVITKGSLRFFMLPKGDDDNYRHGTTIPRSEWVLMHSVRVDSLRKDAGLRPGVVQMEEDISRKTTTIYLESFIPWNPLVAVLRQGSMVFLYNLGSKSIQLLQFYGRPHNYGSDNELLCPYLEPPFLSSYCL